MATNAHFKLTTRNAMLNTLNTSIGVSAVFEIWSGPQPTDVSSAVCACNVVVACLTFPSTSAFTTASNGVMTANALASDTSAAGGTAEWFSILMSNATTRVCDGDVGTSGSDLNLNSTAITGGATVAISAFTITMSA